MSAKNEITIWAAVGPNGNLVKSSIGSFRAAAQRWAMKRNNYTVVKLGSVPEPKVPANVNQPVRRRRRRAAEAEGK